MRLTDEHIVEFQMLYRRHFGRDIGKDEALEKGLRLIRLIEITIKHEASKTITNQLPNHYDIRRI